MVDVDFTMAIPASAYYVAVNMLFEFNPYGQVIPTRIDILPYKLSPFAEYKEDQTATIDFLKFMLVIYTAYAVYGAAEIVARRDGLLSILGFTFI